MAECTWCGLPIEGECHHTDIGTLCDSCEAFMVPHFCFSCGRELPDGVYCELAVAPNMAVLVCPGCYRRGTL